MRALRTGLVCIALAGMLHTRAVAQEDTPPGTNRLPEDHSPRGALWRAAAVPGWGQLYNRQVYKIPIVYAGLGGLTVSALLVNQRYLLYRHSYLYVVRPDDFPEYEGDYRRLIEQLGVSEDRAPQLASVFRANRDNLRRNRDLLYIGIGLFYGLSILDAYVNAHLLDFDVGEDLSISVYPTPGGFAASVLLQP